jgi:hypothetical protein
LHRNKKGISAMVGYVLLIIIAVALAAGVFTFLRTFIPKERVECPEEIHIVIQDYVCSSGVLNLTFSNRGLFTVDGVYVRAGTQEKKVRTPLNDPDAGGKERDKFYIDLVPGNKTTRTYASDQFLTPGEYVVEVEPGRYSEEGLWAICERALVTQTIQCD